MSGDAIAPPVTVARRMIFDEKMIEWWSKGGASLWLSSFSTILQSASVLVDDIEM